MSPNSTGVPDEVLGRVEEGLKTYLTADAVGQLLDALDLEALVEELSVDDAVDSQEMGKVLGRAIGRAITKEMTSYVPLGQAIEMTIGEEIGEQVGEAAVVAFIEYGDPEATIERIRTMVEGEELNRIGGGIHTAVRESRIRDHVPEIRGNGAFPWNSDDATSIEITEDARNE